MKTKNNFFLFFIILSFPLIICSCDESTVKYADQLKAQEKLIKKFIEREGINVLSYFPETFGENDYVLTKTGLYFHLTSAGEGDTITTGKQVSVRYKQKALGENAILEEYWTTQDSRWPYNLTYLTVSSNDCPGWHEAIGYMKRSDSECKIIVPASLGFPSAKSNVIPYYYELKIKFHP